MKKFRVSFSSTGNPELDTKLREMETREHPFEEIVETCATCDVSAQILGESGKLLGVVERGGYRIRTP